MLINTHSLNLALARSVMGYQELIDATGLPAKTIINISNRENCDIDPRQLGIIARALSCDPAELLDPSELLTI